jgi:translation initiation factor IF-3
MARGRGLSPLASGPEKKSQEENRIPARSRSRYRIVAPERDTTRVNERIRVREVRVIGSDSEQLGVMTPEDAMALAREEGLDLVEVAATSRPPVCRIMDYGKYKYEQKKKKSSKQSHAAALKEVKLRPGTDLHDLNFKLNNVRRFLIDGDKVKVTVMFRGREMVHTGRGRTQLKEVIKRLGPIAKMENPPRMEGRFMSMILIADREAVAEIKRQEEADAKVAAAAAAAAEGAEGAEAAETSDDAGAEASEEVMTSAASEVESEPAPQAPQAPQATEETDASEAASKEI